MTLLDSDQLIVSKFGDTTNYKIPVSDLRMYANIPRLIDNYITRVETADGELLEESVKKIMGDLIYRLCMFKYWDPINVACLMRGPRTLAGCLVPLKESSVVTNVGFLEEDYTRTTGLQSRDAIRHLVISSETTRSDVHMSFWRHNSGIEWQLAGMMGNVWDSGKICDQIAFHGPPNLYSGRAEGGVSNATSRATGTGVGLDGTLAGFYGACRKESTKQVMFNPSSSSTTSYGEPSGNRGTNLYVFKAPNISYGTKSRLSWFSHGKYVDCYYLRQILNKYMTDIDTALATL